MVGKLFFKPVFLILLLVLATNIPAWSSTDTSEDVSSPLPMGRINEDLANIAYNGDEVLRYDISWLGGVKIGEITMEQSLVPECSGCYSLEVKISSTGGIIEWLYPVRDRHVTLVKGEQRLPHFSENWQQEGRSYKAHKIFTFDQENFTIIKQKDGEKKQEYNLTGTVHNEFSSFYSSRVMDLKVGQPIIVPTFGNEKRHEVVVETLAVEKLDDTILGSVQTLKISPILTFSGLYDKRGDTVIWFTDDECRIPLKVESKIIIGSLQADLTSARNLDCKKYTELQ